MKTRPLLGFSPPQGWSGEQPLPAWLSASAHPASQTPASLNQLSPANPKPCFQLAFRKAHTGTEPTQQQRPAENFPAGGVREAGGSAAEGEGQEQRRLWAGPTRGCSYLCGAGCPEGLDEPLEPLQHGAGAEHREPCQHDERQHLGRRGENVLVLWGTQLC